MFHSTKTMVYVPNKFCNLGCKYCYLGTNTEIKEDTSDIIKTLQHSIDIFHNEGYVIDCFILHGAEVTTINKNDLRTLLEYINNYRNKYDSVIRALGTRKPFIHVKTNLYNLENYIDLFSEFGVSISGSLDLPFTIHDKFRVTKNNKPTSEKILNNIKLLKDYKFGKQLSCVVTKEVFYNKEKFVKDLISLSTDYDFNINSDFYIMFSYDSNAAINKHNELNTASMLGQDELVLFYNYLKDCFVGTEFELGLNYNWFKEFLPGYCTFEQNCSSNILIQKNGDIYPCHRGQPNNKFKFGNIYQDSYKNISSNGYRIIQDIENEMTMSTDCLKCDYFLYCKLNCTLIRSETLINKSYTCSLQKELYKDNPSRFPIRPIENREAITNFILENNIKEFYNPDTEILGIENEELKDYNNSIKSIIKNDVILNNMFSYDAFKLGIYGNIYSLLPEVNKLLENGTFEINKDDKVYIYIKKEYFLINTIERDLDNNTLYLIFLRDTYKTYGDEGRMKQEHINNFEIYHSEIKKYTSDLEGYYKVDITKFLELIKDNFINGIKNMLYITTSKARMYHYDKQKNNGFYHIQALNLPFHNLNFLYKD